MQKGPIIIVVILALVVIGVLLFSLNKPEKYDSNADNQNAENNQVSTLDINQANNTSANNQDIENTNAPTNNQGTQPTSYSIEISGFAFSPAALTIKVGDSVTWTNKDSARHTVTSDSGSELNSASLSKDGVYSHIFNTAGEYNYHCTPHLYMTAKIIVE